MRVGQLAVAGNNTPYEETTDDASAYPHDRQRGRP